MRFCKETRALIHGAAPHPVTIPWPKGEREPQMGRIYWMQSKEDAAEAAKKAKARREHSPETHAEVLAGMYRRRYGEEPERKQKKKRRRQTASSPRAGDPRIMVLDTTILDKGWEALVALYEHPDPPQHLRIKAKVPGGPNHLYEGIHEPTETEPERLDTPPSRTRRLEEEEALKIEHKASVDRSELFKSEAKLAKQRRRGNRAKLAEAAVERAKRRVDLAAADGIV
jgi:hypothetical protein